MYGLRGERVQHPGKLFVPLHGDHVPGGDVRAPPFFLPLLPSGLLQRWRRVNVHVMRRGHVRWWRVHRLCALRRGHVQRGWRILL